MVKDMPIMIPAAPAHPHPDSASARAGLPRRPALLHYVVAALTVAAAAAVRAALTPMLGGDAPLIIFIVPTVVAAVMHGPGPALLATGLSSTVGTYLFIETDGWLWPAGSSDQVRLVIFLLENLAIVGLVSALHAVHARKRAIAPGDATRMLGRILDSTPHAIIAADFHGKITAWNAAATRMFGFSPDEVLGKPAPHVPFDGRATYEVTRARVLHGERFKDVPITRRRKDGTIAQCQLSVVPLQEEGQRIVGTVTTLVEV